MAPGLACAVGTSLCCGVRSVLQSAMQRAHVVSTPAQWLVVAAAVALVPASFPLPVHVLLRAPAFHAMLVAAPPGLTAYATALQRGNVVEATAPLVVGETVLQSARR